MAWSPISNIKGPTGNTGPAGPTGSTGAAGPPGQGYTWKGAWNSGTAYVPYDSVSNAGSSYVCTVGNTNQAPPNTSYWNILAQQGVIGNTGPAGPTGSTGTPGATGTRGSQWYTGSGAPGTITGELAGDLYLDTTAGDVYQFS